MKVMRSKSGEVMFNARNLLIALISVAAIAAITFGIGFFSGSSQKSEEAEISANAPKVEDEPPAAPGAVTKKLDTDAILKERELEKAAVPPSQFTFQKTLMQDTAPAIEPAPAPQPEKIVVVEKKEPQSAPAPAQPAETKQAEPKSVEPKPVVEKKAVDKKRTASAVKEKKETERKEKQTAPSHESTATSGKVFTIQVASFSTKTEAEKLAAKLAAKRLITNIVEYKDKGAIWYRVRVGIYKTEQAALRDLPKVKAEGSQNAFVTGY